MRLYVRKLAHFKNSRSAKTCGARQAHQAPPRHGANPHKQQLQGSKPEDGVSGASRLLERWLDGRWKRSGLAGKSRDRFPRGIIPDCVRGDRAHPPTPSPPRYPFVLFPPEDSTIAAGHDRIGKEESDDASGGLPEVLALFGPLALAPTCHRPPPASRPPPPGLFGLGRHLSATRLSPFSAQIFRQFTTSPPYLRAMDTNSHELTAAPSFLTQLRCHGLI